MLLYPLLSFGVSHWLDNAPVQILALTLAYILGIYLIRGIAMAAAEGRTTILLIVAAASAVLYAAVTNPQQLLIAEIGWIAIVAAGIIVGRRALVEQSQFRLYLWGMAAVVLGGLLIWAPLWPAMIQFYRDSTGEVVTRVREMALGVGYTETAAEELAASMRGLLNTITKLLPTGTIMSIVAQYSVGFLWFLYRGVPSRAKVGELKPFTQWKVPFALTPVLIAAILAYQLGGTTISLGGLNVLAALSIFYCVGGLSLMENLLARLKLPLWIKVMFYIALTLSGLIGYFGAALLGFIDSFADWRKVSGGAINLNNSD